MEKLIPKSFDKVIESWLQEDIPSINYHAFIAGDQQQKAILYIKQSGVVSGLAFFSRIFQKLSCEVSFSVPEGTFISVEGKTKVAIGHVTGKVCDILEGERLALNILSHCSGISTNGRQLYELKKKHNWHGKIAGTRKTLPGLRLVQKYALLVAGLDTHRFDLSSAIMIKDNHIKALGSISKAIAKAKEVISFANKIEVEAKNLEEAMEAGENGADIVMFDNYGPKKLKEDAAVLKKKFPKIIIESSGGITEETIADYFDENVDVISMGGVTQEVEKIDFSLKVE